jgi:hypothetical protein
MSNFWKEFWLRNWWIVLLVVGLAVAIIVAAYSLARDQNRGEIVRLMVEAERARDAKRELEKEVDALTAKQEELQAQVQSTEADAAAALAQVAVHRAAVERLERERADARLTVRKLRTEDALTEKFRSTFPALAHAHNFGVTDLYDDVNDVTLPYLFVPAWSAETFIIEHAALANAEAQIAEYRQIEDQYGKAVDLHQRVIVLERAKFDLERAKTAAYRDGYNECHVRYEGVVDRYITQLEKPRFQWPGMGTALVCGAAGVGGFVLGTKF